MIVRFKLSGYRYLDNIDVLFVPGGKIDEGYIITGCKKPWKKG